MKCESDLVCSPRSEVNHHDHKPTLLAASISTLLLGVVQSAASGMNSWDYMSREYSVARDASYKFKYHSASGIGVRFNY